MLMLDPVNICIKIMSYVKLDAILSLLYFAVLTCYGENKMDVD